MHKENSQTSVIGKTTFELAYMRRICIREQKLCIISRKLEQDLPVITIFFFLYFHIN